LRIKEQGMHLTLNEHDDDDDDDDKKRHSNMKVSRVVILPKEICCSLLYLLQYNAV